MVPNSPGNALPEGYELYWYRIERVLGQGAFGITYLATDTHLNRAVAIKEYLPVELAVRDGRSTVRPLSGGPGREPLFEKYRRGFLEEARTLAGLSHPNIVPVVTTFEASGTAYFVMQHETGKGLDALANSGQLESEAALLALLHPLLDGLQHMHEAGCIHRDIKPANIHVRETGEPVLLGFGAARFAIGTETHALTAVLTEGFAPPEQYRGCAGEQGPWTDIYGMGATLYACIDRPRRPVEAGARGIARAEAGPGPRVPAATLGEGRYSPRFLEAVDRALAIAIEDRPRSVAQWRAMFPVPGEGLEIGDPTVHRPRPANAPGLAGAVGGNAQSRAETAGKRRHASGQGVPLAALVLSVTVAGGGWLLHESGGTPVPAGAQPVATQPPATAGSAEAAPLPRVAAARDAEQARNAQIDRLPAAAQTDVEALRVTSPEGNGAVEKYRRAPEMGAGNAEAVVGLSAVEGRYVERAEPARNGAEFDQAGACRRRAEGVSVDGAMVADARALPASAREPAGRRRTAADLAGEMVTIEAGCFQMGSPDDEEGRDADERRHRVCIEKDFALGRHEVTVVQFRRFVGATGYRTDAEKGAGGKDGCWAYDRDADPQWGWRGWASWRAPNQYQPNTDDHPVSCVSWNDAVAYAKWLSGETDLDFRLPTEAEWEFAARAGTATARFWGNDPDDACRYANVADQTTSAEGRWSVRHECKDGHFYVAPVSRFQPNAFGLRDMLGNVWEWTCSSYAAHYGGSELRCATGAGGRRVIRGGSWDDFPRSVRSADRGRGTADYRFNGLGFRLARPTRAGPFAALPGAAHSTEHAGTVRGCP